MGMREILFRGKTIADDSLWVEGFYNHIPCGRFSCDEHLIQTIKSDGRIDQLFVVYENTVGQFTGLTDKNGKKIFEGDIVNILGNQDSEDWKNVNYNALIAFLDGGFCAIDGTIEEHAFRRYALERMDFDLEVIGNIHDNPELLEVE